MNITCQSPPSFHGSDMPLDTWASREPYDTTLMIRGCIDEIVVGGGYVGLSAAGSRLFQAATSSYSLE